MLPAQHGGFMVMESMSYRNQGMLRSMLFAGSLTDCLKFVEKHFGGPEDVIEFAKSGQLGPR